MSEKFSVVQAIVGPRGEIVQSVQEERAGYSPEERAALAAADQVRATWGLLPQTNTGMYRRILSNTATPPPEAR